MTGPSSGRARPITRLDVPISVQQGAPWPATSRERSGWCSLHVAPTGAIGRQSETDYSYYDGHLSPSCTSSTAKRKRDAEWHEAHDSR